MATKADSTEPEWNTLERGVTGAGMLVSMSDPSFSDSFGESKALATYLTGQRAAGATQLTRQLGAARGTSFGMTAKPEEIHAGTMDALRSAMDLLSAKAPEEVEPYREMVIGAAIAVAEAKSGVKPAEAATIDAIKEALGVA